MKFTYKHINFLVISKLRYRAYKKDPKSPKTVFYLIKFKWPQNISLHKIEHLKTLRNVTPPTSVQKVQDYAERKKFTMILTEKYRSISIYYKLYKSLVSKLIFFIILIRVCVFSCCVFVCVLLHNNSKSNQYIKSIY